MVVSVQNPTVMGYFEPTVKCYSDVVVDTVVLRSIELSTAISPKAIWFTKGSAHTFLPGAPTVIRHHQKDMHHH